LDVAFVAVEIDFPSGPLATHRQRAAVATRNVAVVMPARAS